MVFCGEDSQRHGIDTRVRQSRCWNVSGNENFGPDMLSADCHLDAKELQRELER